MAAVFLYLLNVVADAWKPAAALKPFTPFHYYPGLAVANGSAPVAYDLGVLAAATAALVAVAFWRFKRAARPVARQSVARGFSPATCRAGL